MLEIHPDDDGVQRKLDALDRAAGDLRPVFETIGRVLVNRIRLCFKLGIDPWGTPWAALRIRKGQPLRDTGRLQRSIVPRVDASGVTIGTNLKTRDGASYPAVHQFGAVITPKKAKHLAFPGPNGGIILAKRVTIPARPFLPMRRDAVVLPDGWSRDVTNALRRHLAAAIKD